MMSRHPWDVQRRKIVLGLAGVGLLAVLLFAFNAHAQKAPKSELQLLTLLNGTPVKIGTLTSTGSSVTNATTATPFTVTGGKVVMIECDGAAHVGPGSSASATATNAAYKPKVSAAPERIYIVLQDAADTVAMISSSGTVNCAYFEMR